MIYFDVTKTASSGHKSGLTRVSSRLREELGTTVTPVSWADWDRAAARGDWYLEAELFSEAERPGFAAFVRGRVCSCAAIYYDAIPLKFPRITWPRSVARHPGYMKSLADFDRIWAISAASRDELLGYWRWQGVSSPPPVDVLTLGADFEKGVRLPPVNSRSELTGGNLTPSPALLCVGILEPRKNQSFLLDVCADLWDGGLAFDLHLVGRVNPHFGKPLLARIHALQRKYPGLHYHAALDDAGLARLFSSARATVYPTIAEGCGLPLTESLWKGVPCVASDLAALRENAAGGGCVLLPPCNFEAWKAGLRDILTDDGLRTRLAAEAISRPLPTWADAARAIRSGMEF